MLELFRYPPSSIDKKTQTQDRVLASTINKIHKTKVPEQTCVRSRYRYRESARQINVWAREKKGEQIIITGNGINKRKLLVCAYCPPPKKKEEEKGLKTQ